MSKMQRRKGASFENHVADDMRQHGFPEAKRHLEFQSQEADFGRDLDNTQPFAIQCKCWKSTPSISAIQEIATDDRYLIPVAFLKRTQAKCKPGIDVVVIPREVFLKMLDICLESYQPEYLGEVLNG